MRLAKTRRSFCLYSFEDEFDGVAVEFELRANDRHGFALAVLLACGLPERFSSRHETENIHAGTGHRALLVRVGFFNVVVPRACAPQFGQCRCSYRWTLACTVLPVAVMVDPQEGQASASSVHMPRWGMPVAEGRRRSNRASDAIKTPRLYRSIRACASLSPLTAARAIFTSYLSVFASMPRRLFRASSVFDS